MTETQLLQEQALEIMEIIEDSVEHYCDNRMVSGEKIWVMIRALCDCKLADFPFEDDIEKDHSDFLLFLLRKLDQYKEDED